MNQVVEGLKIWNIGETGDIYVTEMGSNGKPLGYYKVFCNM